MGYKLYLDDVRKSPFENWVLVKSYKEFCDYITEHGAPSDISFDHDLGGAGRRAKTGYDCVKWLVGEDMDGRLDITNLRWSVHSANPVGARNIRKYMKNYLKSKEESDEGSDNDS